MSDHGIKWTKGADVSTAGLKDLLIHSSFPLLKIKEIGTGSVTYEHDGTGTDQLVVDHGLSYTPLYRFLMQKYDIDAAAKSNDYYPMPMLDTLVGGAIYFSGRSYIDGTELRIAVDSFDGEGEESITLNYLYIVYYDPDADL